MAIGYTKHHATWADGAGGGTPVDSGAMNAIETGIKAACDACDGFEAGTKTAGNADTLDTRHLAEVMPVGSVIMFADDALPAGGGWLECNGAAVSQATYSALWGVIGTHYNIGGEGTGNFRLPDFRGYFPRGWDHGAGVDSGRGLGAIGGTTMAQADSVKEHYHHFNIGTEGGPSSAYPHAGGNYAFPTDNGHYTGGAALSTVETRPKNVSIQFIIKYR